MAGWTHACPRMLATVAAFITIVAMAGCDRNHQGPVTSSSATSGQSDFSSEITGYNHTDRSISSFSVDGVWGGNATPHSGGGKSTCCLQLPEQWREGLSVKVQWVDDQDVQHEREVPVPRYKNDAIGIFNVHFLRDGSIKVFDLNGILGSPGYPLQGDAANLDPGHPNFQYPSATSSPH